MQLSSFHRRTGPSWVRGHTRSVLIRERRSHRNGNGLGSPILRRLCQSSDTRVAVSGCRPGSPRPALEEFLAAMQRRRRPATVGTGDPIVVLPIPKRLGSRAEAAKKVLRRTGERIGSLWVTSADFDSPDLSQSEASAIAEEALVATLSPALRTVPNHFDICFVTRGHGQPARFLTIRRNPLGGRIPQSRRAERLEEDPPWARRRGACAG